MITKALKIKMLHDNFVGKLDDTDALASLLNFTEVWCAVTLAFIYIYKFTKC